MAPKAFIVGHPVKHSRSPLIHGYWLRQHGLAGSYEQVEVAPEGFPAFLTSLAAQGYVGGNVTIPHKEAAFTLVNRASERAGRLGAVNTVWIEDGVLWGDNTDGIGFLGSLDQALGPNWAGDDLTALVLGAGGAARAVVAALLERSIRTVLVANRTPERARELERSDPACVRAMPWDAIPDVLARARLIVNTTSLGMAGQPPLAIDLTRAPDDAVVTDIVYVPLVTPLLRAAAARGLRTVDGLGMLLHQAVPGFARWFGVTPQVTPELRALVAADVEGRA